MLFREGCSKSVGLKKVRHVLPNPHTPPKAPCLQVQCVNLEGYQTYEQAYLHPGIVRAEGETDVDYEPNIENDARNEMGE